MRILILTTYFAPESAANAMLMTLLADTLTQRGHEVTVITGMPHYDNNRIAHFYRGRLWARDSYNKVKLIRVYLYVATQKDRMMGRLLSYLSFNVLSAVAGAAAGNCDILFVPSPPLTNGVTAYAIASLRRIPFIYNVQDIYPDVAIRLGILKNPHLIRFFQSMENFVYRKAAAVCVISHSIQRKLLAKGVPAEKLSIIPNFIDTEFVTPLPRHNGFSCEHHLDDKFVVLYGGNIGLSQGLDKVLEAADRLRDQPGIHFVFVGNGTMKPKLVQMVEEMRLTSVTFLPFQGYERIPEVYSTANVCLIPLRSGFTEDSLPSKFFTITGVARPIIASVDEGSEIGELVVRAQCGLTIAPEDPEALAEAVLKLYHDREGAAQMGRNGRQFVVAEFTLTQVVDQYEQLFQSVTTKYASTAKNEQHFRA